MSDPSTTFLENFAMGLRRDQARLYDHFGLQTLANGSERDWKSTESDLIEEQATRIAAAAISVSYRDKRLATLGFRRAAEIFEWLVPEKLDSNYRIISAALYQLADLPAMAKSVIENPEQEDALLAAFLAGDFTAFEEQSHDTADRFGSDLIQTLAPSEDPQLIARHLHACLNQVVGALKWADVDGSAAITGLTAIADLFYGSSDAVSWLLAALVKRISEEYLARSLRYVLRPLEDQLTEGGNAALERYLRVAYVNGRCLSWPPQRIGIALVSGQSNFALCTPTGSGKTTIAELAILQSVYSKSTIHRENGPIAIYLVPSRALAAEVEKRLAASLKHSNVKIMSSYGGYDMSANDSSLLASEPVVLVCTQEKADSLIRIVGSPLLTRVSLVVIDEAHNIQVRSKYNQVRGLRLEQLIARLRKHSDKHCRFIALSAVTSREDHSLEKWLSDDEAMETNESYQSTRRVFGRLNVSSTGNFTADYDLLNGSMLGDENLESFRPRLPNIVSRYPHMSKLRVRGKKIQPEVELRTCAFWAAIELTENSSGAVLITFGSKIENHAKAFLKNLEEWKYISKLEARYQKDKKDDEYSFALASCEDYFGAESYEYRLLKVGVIVHHGRLPIILQRRFTRLIETKAARICIATSTLSEGVNLPFETILVPSLRGHGGTDEYSVAELRNLVGRAGRPGKAREGRALVLMGSGKAFGNQARQYQRALNGMRGISEDGRPESALIALLETIRRGWMAIGSPLTSVETWLESLDYETITDSTLIDCVDDLDSFILSVLEEDGFYESAQVADIETLLTQVWKYTYAYAVSGTQQLTPFLARGQWVGKRISADRARQQHRTGLRTRSVDAMLAISEEFRERLQSAFGFYQMSRTERITFFSEVMQLFQNVPQFDYSGELKATDPAWRTVLSWWLFDPQVKPTPSKVSRWYAIANSLFSYRFSWAFSSAVLIHTDANPISEFNLYEENTEIPKAMLWIREMMQWGTTDPIVAAVLQHDLVATRIEAEQIASLYNAENEIFGDDMYDRDRVDYWLQSQKESQPPEYSAPFSLEIEDLAAFPGDNMRVRPNRFNEFTLWRNIAGYPVAKSKALEAFDQGLEFVLNKSDLAVKAEAYL